MLEPPYCFFYSSIQALTFFFFFLLCFAMPGILCLGEIAVTCQTSIKRGKIPSLTFSRGLVFQTRTGSLREGKRPKRGNEQKRLRECQVTSLPGTPHINTPSSVFSCAFLLSLTSFTLESSVLPQKAECGYSDSVWRQSQAFFPPRCLTVCLPRWTTLKAEGPSINNPAFLRVTLYLVLSAE